MRLSRLAMMLYAMFIACSLTPAAQAQVNEEEDDLKALYGDKQTVSIATGSQKSVRLAPAVTSVITATDIRAMGASDLDQVMESIAGMHVARFGAAYFPAYVVRGIISDLNPQILVLQNGIPLTVLFQGNKTQLWGGYPLQHVARIEIIRGPGSALYGADAYSGVINIITKGPSDIQGTEAGISLGSFASRDVWVQHASKLGVFDVSAFVRFARTDGNNAIIDSDAQSGLDKIFGTHASLAPGPMNNGYDALDANIELNYGKWRLRGNYILRDNLGTGTGIAYALDPEGKMKSQRLTSDLSWVDSHLDTNWGMGFNLSLMQYLQSIPVPLNLFPPGVSFPTGSFENGMKGAPYTSERQLRMSAFATYSGWSGHHVRFGLGHDDLNLYDTLEYKNFLITASGLPQPAGALKSFTSPLAFLDPHRRKIDYVFVQDEWQLAPDWSLTAGVRHDRYSDVGNTTNPRLALVWEAAYDVTIKLLYGAAFRAPSFVELYSINNPTQRGNPAIQPETIKTLEAALVWQARPELQTKLNIFEFRMKNLIRTVPDTIAGSGSAYANTSGQNGHGMEIELNWQANHQLKLAGNYSYQRNIDQTSGQDAGYAPHHHVFARADWQMAPSTMLSTQFNWVAKRERTAGDLRPPVADYKTIDINLRHVEGPWEIAASVRNLMNVDAREPSFAPGTIPNDIPLPRRSFYLQTMYRF